MTRALAIFLGLSALYMVVWAGHDLFFAVHGHEWWIPAYPVLKGYA